MVDSRVLAIRTGDCGSISSRIIPKICNYLLSLVLSLRPREMKHGGCLVELRKSRSPNGGIKYVRTNYVVLIMIFYDL